MDGEPKPLFEVGGRTLLHRAVEASRGAIRASRGAIDAAGDVAPQPDAAEDGHERFVTVVAPVLDPALDVDWVREDPPFGGPAAATIAALDAWAARGFVPDLVLLLASDLPRVESAVAVLCDGILLAPSDIDGLCLADASSRPQWLTGIYRTASLLRAAARVPDAGRDASMRALLDDLAISVVAVADEIVDDVDTWEDLARARAACEEIT